MRIRLRPPVDRLDAADETLLLYPERVVRLGALGRAVVDLVRHLDAPTETIPNDGCPASPASGIALQELAAALVDAWGQPSGDPLAFTRDAVVALVAEGVLEEVDGPSPVASDGEPA